MTLKVVNESSTELNLYAKSDELIKTNEAVTILSMRQF